MILQLLANRFSPYSYNPKIDITREELDIMLAAAISAPSCYNEQPWSFVWALKGDPSFERVLGTLVEANQKWAKDASALGVVCHTNSFEKTGKPNKWAAYDVGGAMALFTVQANHMGYQVHQMGGFSPKKVHDMLGVPEDIAPIAAVAVGKPLGEPENRSSRKPIQETVHGDGWEPYEPS